MLVHACPAFASPSFLLVSSEVLSIQASAPHFPIWVNFQDVAKHEVIFHLEISFNLFLSLNFFWKYCASATAIFGLLRAECGLNPGSSKYSLAAFNAYLHEGFATKKIHLTTVWHKQSKIQKMLVIPKFQTLTFQYFRSVFLPMAFSASFKSIFLVVNSLAFSVFVA